MSKGVRGIYSEIFSTYESVNHILTLGFDLLWRRKAADIAGRTGGKKWLEVCTGTGETAIELQKYASTGTSIVAADFSLPMLEKAITKDKLKKPALLLAEAGTLPFSDETFDLVMITFATRNLNSTRARLDKYLREFYRILKPGGRFINVETSQPSSPLIRSLYHLYVRLTVLPIGKLVSGSKSGYSYLSSTIRRFHPPVSLAEILQEAGFKEVRWSNLLLGTAAIHEAVK
ncbi:MAG: ubiquinone/menaquinone biosynthesis methyltransferase [Candidatus Thorarchaeota archaeon]|nr:ubiquinone/menaquinone biosynthesis methyltransferase [Candidatus Thorarchaeota archaeon]